MHARRIIPLLASLTAIFALTYGLAADWERKLAVSGKGPGAQRALAGGSSLEDRLEKGTAQKIGQSGGVYSAQYNFINFNRNKLGVSYEMKEAEFRAYMAGYGYTDQEMEALRDWRDKAHAAAWERGYREGGEPAAQKAIAEVASQYGSRLRGLLLQRGFALKEGNVVECDLPRIVKRNIGALKPLALDFQELSSGRSYGQDETIGAVLSMVQTAVRYQVPPLMDGARHIGGLLPPVKTLLSGWGDCDTKTALTASILLNWSGVRIVGIAVPRHYLMGIRRLPAKGDMFVRYDGLEYVLVEPAGPAWLEPGTVGSETAELLEGSAGYTIEPFF